MQNQILSNPSIDITKFNIKKELIEVLQNEEQSISYLLTNLPSEAERLVNQILQTTGRVIFSGMGKSGLVAKKLVATFSSLGIPSLFLHPVEALHGDLGMVKKGDFFIALSKSGTGLELEQILPVLKQQKILTSLICCSSGILTKLFDLVVLLPFKKEACFLNLAPTSSSTLMIAFGDALAVVSSKLMGFTKNDFAKFHPSGALGKRLLATVESFMHKKDVLPVIAPDSSFADLLVTMTSKKLGVGIVVQDEKPLGIITDGDLRRACKVGPLVFGKQAKDIMHSDPKTIDVSTLAFNSLKLMENHNITSLIVTNKEKIVGLVHIHDLVKAGIKE